MSALGRLVALLLLLAGSLWCQVQSGTIVGTIQDSSGAPVPEVTVTLVNADTSFTRIAKTNTSGQYVAYSVPVGGYTITAEMQGFQKLVRSGVELTVGNTLTVDLQLSVGGLQQTVQVTASAPLLQSQTAEVSSLVTNRQIVELPLVGRTFSSLVLLTPGAYVGSSNNLTNGLYSIRAPANFSVNGSEAQNNSYLIDGLFNRNLWLSTLVMVPVVDAIREFRVLTSNYSAEFGAAAGAVTIVQTKSGTNEWRGDAWEFLRNDKLDANNFFDNRLGAPRPPFRRNEFGGTIGAPLRRNKMFIFGDYQGLRIREPNTFVSTIPTLAQRRMVQTGDFSGLGTTVFDPSTLHNDASGNPVRDPFSGNRILSSRLDPAATKLMDFLPAPTSSAATQNFIFNPVNSQRTDQFDVRFDVNVGSTDRLFFKYSFDDTKLIKPGEVPAQQNTGIPIGPFLSAAGDDNSGVPLRNQSVTINYVKDISSTTVDEVRLGLLRWRESITPLDTPFKTASALGIPGINVSDKSGGIPAFSITGFRLIGDNNTFPEDSEITSLQYEDILTVIRGSHTLKFGGRYVRHRFNGFSAFPIRGRYDFNGQFTRQVGTAVSGTALADFALGDPSAVTRNFLAGTFGMRMWELGTFAEDTWRMTNRLTFNYGLRWDVFAPPYEVHDRWANFDLATGKLGVAGVSGNGRRLRNFDLDNLGPRIGISYALTSDRKTVLRTGFGESYVEAGQGGGQLYKNLPFFVSQVISTNQNGLPQARISDGLPFPSPLPLDSPLLSGGNPTVWDPNLEATRAFEWSFGLQRQVTPNLLLDVSYVGSRSLGLIANYNFNQSFPGAGPQGPRRPLFTINPLVTDTTLRSNYGSSKYHSLQLKVTKRYSAGLTLVGAYTYSHFEANAGNINGGGNGPPQDARCFRCEEGNVPQDRRHVVVINHDYELPFGPGRRYAKASLLAKVLGNWDVSGIWTFMTGGHFTPTFGTNRSNSAGGGEQRPDRVCEGSLPSNQRTIDHYFDLNCFVPPAQFTFGNAGRGILTGPGFANVDLALHRTIPISERFKLRFRWELFNAFNRANFGDPNAVIGTPAAGQISGTGPARVMQAALKLLF